MRSWVAGPIARGSTIRSVTPLPLTGTAASPVPRAGAEPRRSPMGPNHPASARSRSSRPARTPHRSSAIPVTPRCLARPSVGPSALARRFAFAHRFALGCPSPAAPPCVRAIGPTPIDRGPRVRTRRLRFVRRAGAIRAARRLHRARPHHRSGRRGHARVRLRAPPSRSGMRGPSRRSIAGRGGADRFCAPPRPGDENVPGRSEGTRPCHLIPLVAPPTTPLAAPFAARPRAPSCAAPPSAPCSVASGSRSSSTSL